MEITMTRTMHASSRARAWFELPQPGRQRLLADVRTPDQGSTVPSAGVIDGSDGFLAGAGALNPTPIRTGADYAPTTTRMDVVRSLPGRPPV